MNAHQNDIQSMQIVTVDLLNKTTPEILYQMPEIEMVNAAVEENLNKIGSFYSGQQLNRTGNRQTKEELREEMT